MQSWLIDDYFKSKGDILPNLEDIKNAKLSTAI